MIINKHFNIEKETKDISFLKETANTRRAAVIPNVNEIAREMTSKSQILLMVTRVLKIPPQKWISLGFNNIMVAPMILAKNFFAGIKILCELEILKNSRKEYILHNQFVDTAIAVNNPLLLKMFFRLSSKYNFKPGLLTYNPDQLIKLLSFSGKIPENLAIYCPLSKKYLSGIATDHELFIALAKKTNIKFIPID
jgi:hypothetical protein